ncbi:hypothetical protein BDW69DRAFT_194164 [Aspergillus filifer]
MTGSSKDYTGCLTCRLRRIRCDQAQPMCRNCLALDIKCYTDPHKPEWMDNGPKQREMAQRFKVDRDFGREGEVQTSGSCTAEGSNGLETQHRRCASPENTSADTAEVPTASESSAVAGLARISLDRSTTPGLHRFSQPIDNELEMQFVMIYLDYTFPILVGRGWLFALPMKIKALYHTTISLTSYFFSTPIGSGPAQELCLRLAFDEQRKKIDLAVKMGVHNDLFESIYLLESIVQLLIFDGVVAITETRRMHLDAVIVLFEQIIPPHGSVSSIPNAMRQRSGRIRQAILSGALTKQNSVSTLLFADTMALEQPPKLRKYHVNFLGDKSGAGNRASLQLEDLIATLDPWRKDMKKRRCMNMMQLMECAATAHSTSPIILPTTPPPLTPSQKCPVNATTRTISQFWAHAARIYLQTVISGWQTASPATRSDVFATLGLLTDISRFAPGVIRALALPFCVAGCPADQEQESDFRDIAAMRTMENIRKRRDEADGDDSDVAGCLRSQGFKVLLI